MWKLVIFIPSSPSDPQEKLPASRRRALYFLLPPRVRTVWIRFPPSCNPINTPIRLWQMCTYLVYNHCWYILWLKMNNWFKTYIIQYLIVSIWKNNHKMVEIAQFVVTLKFFSWNIKRCPKSFIIAIQSMRKTAGPRTLPAKIDKVRQ